MLPGKPLFQDTGSDSYRVFQRKFLSVLMAGVAALSAIFVLADWLNLNSIGEQHLRATEIYCLLNLALLVLHRDRRAYIPIATFLMLLSFLFFTSALLFVPGDELRVVWFFMGVAGTYILLGQVPGLLFTLAAIATVVVVNPNLPAPYSRLAMTAFTLSLLSFSLFFFVFTTYTLWLYRRLEDSNAHLVELSMYDSLTLLPNRRLLSERLQRAFVEGRRSGRFGALMFLDLDRFKQVNDTLGHDVGDALLIQIGRRLKSCVREMDTVARMGGDEFIVLLPSIGADADSALLAAKTVGAKILETLNDPHQIGEHVCSSTPSIGLTVFSGDSNDVEAIFRRADAAMYQVKAAGRNGMRVLLK